MCAKPHPVAGQQESHMMKLGFLVVSETLPKGEVRAKKAAAAIVFRR
jgi:hypothetical protein